MKAKVCDFSSFWRFSLSDALARAAESTGRTQRPEATAEHTSRRMRKTVEYMWNSGRINIDNIKLHVCVPNIWTGRVPTKSKRDETRSPSVLADVLLKYIHILYLKLHLLKLIWHKRSILEQIRHSAPSQTKRVFWMVGGWLCRCGFGEWMMAWQPCGRGELLALFIFPPTITESLSRSSQLSRDTLNESASH